MTVKDLLNEFESIRCSCVKKTFGGDLLASGEQYDEWLLRCRGFLEQNYPNEPLTNRFITTEKDKSERKQCNLLLIL